MADAVIPRWHGDNYQARVFWENALNLLVPGSCVVEVTFEANGPKAFDDVVVKYDPPVARGGPERVSAEYHQVKWHVDRGGRFGYADLIDPAFLGAKTFSLLERLRDAKEAAPPGSRFAFITTYRVRDDDPLGPLVSGVDRSLRLQVLFDGTTDKSRMGKIRKLWRTHLRLKTDHELRSVLEGFRIIEGHRTLEELRSQINVRAQAVGLLTCSDADSDFRFDELARQLKVRRINALSRPLLEELCREEGLYAPQPTPAKNALPIAIVSFLGPASDMIGATPDNTLLLSDAFNARYLAEGQEWRRDIRPRVESFVRERIRKSTALRLTLDAHSSIAFLAGSALDHKSGADVDLIQKGRVGARVWRADDGAHGPAFVRSDEQLGTGADLAIFISATHSVEKQARGYIADHLPGVGRILSFTAPGHPGAASISGGAHAAAIADQIVGIVRTVRDDPDDMIHIFGACPNALFFFLGQQHQAIAPALVYEFDFDRQGNKSYHPSFPIG